MGLYRRMLVLDVEMNVRLPWNLIIFLLLSAGALFRCTREEGLSSAAGETRLDAYEQVLELAREAGPDSAVQFVRDLANDPNAQEGRGLLRIGAELSELGTHDAALIALLRARDLISDEDDLRRITRLIDRVSRNGTPSATDERVYQLTPESFRSSEEFPSRSPAFPDAILIEDEARYLDE